MKIRIKGEMTVPALRQAIFEQLREMEVRFAIRHVRGTSLYLTPTNGFGEEVSCRDAMGAEIQTLYSKGPYKSAAEDYEI